MHEHDSRRGLVYFIGFMDLLAVSIVIPALPVYLTKCLNTSSTSSGAVTSLYGAVQLFSSPIAGWWSDQKGRLEVLYMSLLICAVGYFFLGYSMHHILTIAALRVIPGLFKHTQDLSRCLLLADRRTARHEVLGIFYAMSSIGFAIGPAIHGHLVAIFGLQMGFSISCMLCSIIFLINGLIVRSIGYRLYFGVKDSLCDEKIENDSGNGKNFDCSSSWKFSSFHQGIFITRFFHALSVMMFRSAFVLWLVDCHPDLPPIFVGYILSLNGIFGLLLGFLVGPISRLAIYKNHEERLHFHASMLLVFFLILPLSSSNMLIVLFSLAGLALTTAILRVSGVVLSVKHLPENVIGHAHGIGSSVISVARFVAPLAVGILQEFSFSVPNSVAFACCVLAAVIFHKLCLFHRHDKSKIA